MANITTITVPTYVPTPTSVGCGTVTTTTARCSSCPVPACAVVSTVKVGGDCPAVAETVTTGWSCDEPCPTNCQDTQYVIVTASTTAPPSGTQCTLTSTATYLASKSEGCAYDCPFDCIRDDAVFLPCGCTRAAKVVTETVTKCATASPCYNCHYGFGLVTVSASNCPTAAPTDGCA
jgi:hypothetical protein